MRNYEKQSSDMFDRLSKRYPCIPSEIVLNACEWFVASGCYIYRMTNADFIEYLTVSDNLILLED